MDGILQSPATVALVVGLGFVVKGLVGFLYPNQCARLLRAVRVPSHPLTMKRLRNDRFANSSFIGIGIGILCGSVVLPTVMVGITTAVGLCSGMATWFFFRMDALEAAPAGDSSARS